MPTVNSSETLSVRGTVDVSSGTLTLKNGQVPRAKLTQEDLLEVGVPLHTLRVWDNVASGLPATPSADDLGLSAGTFGTDSPVVQSVDCGSSGAVSQYARVFIPIAPEYVLGETLEVRLSAGMNPAVADTTATLDLEVYVGDSDGAVGTDLCSTAAQSINSLTKADKDFVIAPATIIHGDVLDCRITVAVNDSATTSGVVAEINTIQLLQDTKG
jgi:hypothetical protein